MAAAAKQKVDHETITSEEAADVFFRDLGIDQKSAGSYKHEWGAAILPLVPLSVLQAATYKRGLTSLDELRKNGN